MAPLISRPANLNAAQPQPCLPQAARVLGLRVLRQVARCDKLPWCIDTAHASHDTCPYAIYTTKRGRITRSLMYPIVTIVIETL
jgi:hypothetical protein